MADGFQLLASVNTTIHRFTLGEVLRMQEQGILPEGRRELIGGVIIDMPSEGELHLDYKVRLTRFFVRQAPDHLRCAVDATLMLDDYDSPDPDLFIFDAGARTHPFDLSKLHLVIEIADSSFAKDTRIKPELYARFGVPEYWVVDVNGRTTWVYRDPANGGYEPPVRTPFDQTLTPLRVPELSLRIAELT